MRHRPIRVFVKSALFDLHRGYALRTSRECVSDNPADEGNENAAQPVQRAGSLTGLDPGGLVGAAIRVRRLYRPISEPDVYRSVLGARRVRGTARRDRPRTRIRARGAVTAVFETTVQRTRPPGTF